VPIFNIMRKFDGATVTDDIKAGRRRFRITRLPQFLCLHMKRFTKVRSAVGGWSLAVGWRGAGRLERLSSPTPPPLPQPNMPGAPGEGPPYATWLRLQPLPPSPPPPPPPHPP
jgi:hypothetical protein